MKQKDERKEQRIKQVTLELVSSSGIAGMKMNQIAQIAQISPSMIYTYFKSKEDLLNQVFRDCVKKMALNFLILQQENLPFEIKLEQYFKKILSIKLKHTKEYNFFLNFKQSPYFKTAHYQSLLENEGNHLANLLANGQQDMIIKEAVPIEFFLALLDGFTNQLINLHEKHRVQLDKKNLDIAFSLFWDGIRQ
jgi:AcrR family transcriptional regulator